MNKMDQASQHSTVSAAYLLRHIASRVMFAIYRHDLESAANWGNKLTNHKDIPVIEFQHVLPRMLIAQGNNEEAANLLRDLYDRFVDIGANGLAINVRVYQALAAATPEEALDFLAAALIRGTPEGYIRTFVDEGVLLAPLLKKALSRGITPEYTRELLTIIEAEDRQKLAVSEKETVPLHPQDLLSERELEVLRLMEIGLANQQIAEKLFISLNTTKNHVHNILEKLDAQNRTEAIARGRGLRLI
jgi:LuxR family maltose regulon positive regulatory protein